ncbi:putative chromatin regulator PHD family [Helianthus annuus]|nr:putative chromatin regulator PHD family [Helianthus annuus]
MEQLQHFSHQHLLSLIHIQPPRSIENSDKEYEDDQDPDQDQDQDHDYDHQDKDDFVVKDYHVGKCKMCKEDIYPFHLCYYSCKDCDYFLHKFCAELPTTLQDHPLHPGHNLTLSERFQFHDPDGFKDSVTNDRVWDCAICKMVRERFYNYHCSICNFTMDIICSTITEQKMDHPSHPHQLLRCFSRIISSCHACGNEHSGTFYHCTTCSWFKIHLDCALLPTKLLIQQYTNESFSHEHLLTLAYSFPHVEKKAKFYPSCRVCGVAFNSYKWHYRCTKCQYYVHVQCATSMSEAFMSILMRAGFGKTTKNFKDEDHPNLIKCPFPDESFNLLKNLFINKGEFTFKRQIDGDMFNHKDPLILLDTQASLFNKIVSLHDPMRKVELLCDGCVRPIMDWPFYKCSEHHCDFVLHEWCTRLPSEIQDQPDHPKHTLVLLPKMPTNFLGFFKCQICKKYSNGFAYGCVQCDYYVDINCAFIPDVITHDAHPDHLLRRFKCPLADITDMYCRACKDTLNELWSFHCPTCDFYVHIECALFIPRTIRHKYDKHPLLLRYNPVENLSGEYFCEICEDAFDPELWFYHCGICASSMHTACAPLILQCEQSTSSEFTYPDSIFKFINVKFGGTHEIKDHPHPVTFVQGINADGSCTTCDEELQYDAIFKCLECNFVCHISCAGVLLSSDGGTDSDASSDGNTNSDASSDGSTDSDASSDGSTDNDASSDGSTDNDASSDGSTDNDAPLDGSTDNDA